MEISPYIDAFNAMPWWEKLLPVVGGPVGGLVVLSNMFDNVAVTNADNSMNPTEQGTKEGIARVVTVVGLAAAGYAAYKFWSRR